MAAGCRGHGLIVGERDALRGIPKPELRNPITFSCISEVFSFRLTRVVAALYKVMDAAVHLRWSSGLLPRPARPETQGPSQRIK